MNLLIRILSYFTKSIEGNPNEWLERDYPLGGIMWREFICGSVRGIYRCENKEFQILAVQNTKKNDNFNRVLQWFADSAHRTGYSVSFLEIGNPKLREKLERFGYKGDEKKMTLTPQS